MDCSPPGSSVHGNSPGKKTGVGSHALLQGIFPTQGLNLGLLHYSQILYRLSHWGNPVVLRTCLLMHKTDMESIPQSGRSPGGEHDYPFQYSCLENPNGQRSLVGYSPWGRKELDMTEWLSTAQHSTWMFLSASNPKSHQCLLTLDYVKSLRKNTAIHINTTPTCNNTVKSPKCQV